MSTRRALLIGINGYQHFTDLQGCENDVRDLLRLLETRYEFTHCRTLLTTEATGAGMRAALQQLVDDTQTGDVVVFFFAGHGSQLRDDDGDEPSGFDNTLVPHDSCHDAARPELNLDIVDDELRGYLEQLTAKTEAVTVIVDACHSGTITRGASSALVTGVRGLPPYLGPRPTRSAAPVVARTRSASTPYVLLAACRDTELASEIGLPQEDQSLEHHGAFSYYLHQQLQQASPTATYRDLFEPVATEVYDLIGGRQRPQMEGAFDRQLFGLTERVPMSYLRLVSLPMADGTFTLAGGRSLGVQQGARVAVYPPGTMSADEAPPLAHGTVTNVRNADSTVQLDAVVADAVDAPAPAWPELPLAARVVVMPDPNSVKRRPVLLAPLSPEALASPQRAELEAAHARLHDALAAVPSLAMTAQPHPDALMLSAWPPDSASGAWRWALTAADGLPMAPLKALDQHEAVVRNCRILARQWLTKQLVNDAQGSALRNGAVSVEVLTAARHKEPYNVAPPGNDGLPVVIHRQTPWALRVHNRHRKPVYVTLIDFTLEGKIEQLYPPNSAAADTAIPPDGQLQMFMPPDSAKGYALPEQFPWQADGAIKALDEAVTSMRLFVTEQPVDFRFLCADEAVRSSGSTMARYFAERLGVQPPAATRSAFDFEEPADVDWTAIDVRFRVRRHAEPAIPVELDRVLDNAGFVVRQTLDTRQATPSSPNTVRLGAVPDGFARVLLMVGNDGMPQFLYPEAPAAAATRSTAAPTEFDFALPVVPSADTTRSLGALLAIPQVKELLVRAIDPVAGAIGEALATKIEAQVRPYALRRVPATLTDEWPEVTAADWATLSSGKVLLVLHGVLATSRGTFSAMSVEAWARLQAAYGGRVIAFDHPTLGHDPRENAEALVRLLPEAQTITADIIGVSRGGLVARVLAGAFDTLSPGTRSLVTERVVLLGTPNDGTPLADPQALKLFTKVAPYLGIGAEVLGLAKAGKALKDVLLGAVTGGSGALLWPLVQQAALAMVSSLPGLECMEPGSAFLKACPGVAPGTRVFGVASSVDALTSLPMRTARFVIGNDLGVQHDLFTGVSSVFGAALTFEDTLTVAGPDGVSHLSYLESRAVQDALGRWLTA